MRHGMMVAVGLCAMVLAASPAAAKGTHDPAKHLDMLDKKLDLTDEQRTQVQQIMDAYRPRFEALQGQMEGLRKEKHDRINALLTPEQQTKFEKINKKKHRKK